LGFGQVTGSPESIYFLKSKRRRFSKKTKINRLQPSFWPGQPGHTRFFIPLFFLQPNPVPALDRPNRPDLGSTRRASRVSKLCSLPCPLTIDLMWSYLHFRESSFRSSLSNPINWDWNHTADFCLHHMVFQTTWVPLQ
jgi:hypothetical protein